jgi:hypothetical protein
MYEETCYSCCARLLVEFVGILLFEWTCEFVVMLLDGTN